MDGPAILRFTMAAVPSLVEEVLGSAGIGKDDVDLYLFHQATRKVLEQMHERLENGEDRLPVELQSCGNTVSSTLPILIDGFRKNGRLSAGMNSMLIGFGVGWSWAGCMWQETWKS